MIARKTKKKTNVEEHEHITVEITGYQVAIDAGRNYELANMKLCDSDTKVFRCDSRVEITGICIYPQDIIGHTHSISIIGTESYDDRYSLTLHDCQAMDGFRRICKTVKGKEVPVYELPDGIGYIEKRRGEKSWSGAAWVQPRSVTDMLATLPHIKPLYLEIHRVKKEKSYLIRTISLTTENSV